MYKITPHKAVVSDEGFSVEILGRTGIRYTEGNKNLFIDSEVLAASSSHGLAMFTDSIQHWDPPHQNEMIEENQKRKIVDNVCQACHFYGIDIQVI